VAAGVESVEKAVLESPILSQIVPPAVLLLPAVVTQQAQQHGGADTKPTKAAIAFARLPHFAHIRHTRIDPQVRNATMRRAISFSVRMTANEVAPTFPAVSAKTANILHTP
jgi:hypothetical protein